MASLSGVLQRPLVAAATAVALTSVSADIPDKLSSNKATDNCSVQEKQNLLNSNSAQELKSSWVSHISGSRLAALSLVTRTRVPVPDVKLQLSSWFHDGSVPNMSCSSVVSSSMLIKSYQSAELEKASKPETVAFSATSPPADAYYRWHLPDPNAVDISGNPDCPSLSKSRTVVVLLGWLGSKQKHLKRYAGLYTSMGFHVVTFTFPISKILSYQVDGKAEQYIDLLANHLVDWLEEEHGKNLLFHTFSNTGWLTYGAILEKFKKQDSSLMDKIKGCIVDSAPVASADPQVFASGFSAAFLKKNSALTKGSLGSGKSDMNVLVGNKIVSEIELTVTEATLLKILEKFFDVVLKLPSVNRRLSDVMGLLTSSQPNCPQLYIYSSADRVIPAVYVESFIEEQKRAGHLVKACNFINTPHVDHFRNAPELYTSQLTQFLETCVLDSCKGTS